MPTKFIYSKKLKEQQHLIDEILDLVNMDPFQQTQVNILATFINSMFQVNYNRKRYQMEEYQKQLEEKRKLESEILKKKRQINQMRVLEMAPRPSYAGAYAGLSSTKKITPKTKNQGVTTETTPNKVQELKPLEPNLAKKKPLKDIPVPPPPSPDGKQVLPENAVKTDKPLPKGPAPKEKKEYIIRLKERPIGVVIDTDDKGILTYTLIEPQVDEALLATVTRLFGKNPEKLEDNNYLNRIVKKSAKRISTTYDPTTVKKIKYHLKKKLGFGKIDTLMHDDMVEEIIIENGQVKVKQTNFNDILPTNILYNDQEKLRERMKKIAKLIGSEISDKNQIVDGKYNGFNIHMEWGTDTEAPKLEIKRLEK